MATIDASITKMPVACKRLICSFNTMRAHRMATGSSTVINMELMPAPIFEMPAANKAVGIVVPTTARKTVQSMNSPHK